MGLCQKYRTILCATIFALIPVLLQGQIGFDFFNDVGANNSSNGLYLKSGALSNFKIDKNRLELGLQNELFGPNENLFNAFRISYSRTLFVYDKAFETKVFYISNLFSGILFERNAGFVLEWKSNHIENALGLDFRRYGYTQKTADQYQIEQDHRFEDSWKLIYHLGGYIKPLENRWNIGLILSNIDHFTVANTTLPAITVRGQYLATPGVDLFFETWFKSTGLASISFNPYGLFMRTGISWKL